MPSDATVYIVDDDEAVRDSLAALLATHGWQTETFESAAVFLSRYRRGGTGCLLLDVRMPGMSGLELQEVLAAQRVLLPVIIITGHGDIPMAVKAMRLGAVDFIEKPFSNEALFHAIEQALAVAQQAERVERAEATKAEATACLAQLTARECEVLNHLVCGHANKMIAYDLGISPRTVEVYRARVMEKMHADSLSQLVRMALAAGVGQEFS